VKFAPGEVLLRRHWRGGRVSAMFMLRVAADDERGLRLWLPTGCPYWRYAGADGRTHRDAPIDQLPGGRLARAMWTGSDVMIWMPEGQSYSVGWHWTDGAFDGWRVSLEEPYVRWSDHGCAGVDTADHSLDVVVSPERSWRWQDEDEFDTRTGNPLYWTQAQALQIRHTGERMAKLAEAGAFPFDGTWTGFRPDASWTIPGLPPGYDRPRAIA
jgi:Protein of unknown function (DUF402)